MKNYVLKIEYDGTRYYGWNLQPNKKTIVSELTKAIKSFYKGKVEIQGSGRTDRGVHALDQRATVLLDVKMSTTAIKKVLNNTLPDDIYIKEVKEVSKKFHARYNARMKVYKYLLQNKLQSITLNQNYAWCMPGLKLDIKIMRKAAKLLTTETDFTSFAYIDKKDKLAKKDTIKTIYSITIKETDQGYKFRLKGKGFLRHMVRKIVGALVEVGKGKITIEDIENMLGAKESKAVPYKAPASGLYLNNVIY